MKPPRRKAVAMGYDAQRHAAPIVHARGSGLVADRIIALAQQHGVPVYEDKALVELLAQLDVHETIPPAWYAIMAEVLARVYEAEHTLSRKGRAP
ncbi:MAG: EscU/YscU/HrcU family type III secretion system export apparatus switch protein [Paenibacillaceae bacterium]|nr:EscU/YscU/HrcU family type III secretion system export apparatus switch protein [Paenibacillaceae bacterium]